MIKGARFSLIPVRVLLLASGGFGLNQRGSSAKAPLPLPPLPTTPTETVALHTQADTLSGAPWREQPKSGLPTIRSQRRRVAGTGPQIDQMRRPAGRPISPPRGLDATRCVPVSSGRDFMARASPISAFCTTGSGSATSSLPYCKLLEWVVAEPVRRFALRSTHS
jgi:hypothetical protein